MASRRNQGAETWRVDTISVPNRIFARIPKWCSAQSGVLLWGEIGVLVNIVSKSVHRLRNHPTSPGIHIYTHPTSLGIHIYTLTRHPQASQLCHLNKSSIQLYGNTLISETNPGLQTTQASTAGVPQSRIAILHCCDCVHTYSVRLGASVL